MVLRIRILMIMMVMVACIQTSTQADRQSIENAKQHGELTTSQYLYYLYLDAFAPDKLPGSLIAQSEAASRCNFGTTAYLKNHLSEVEEPYQSLMRSTLGVRPGGLPYTYLSLSQNFLIHYATIGSDAVDSADTNHNQIPDYVEQTAEIFDYVYQIQIDSLKYQKYKQDVVEGSQFDVYIKSISGYGYTDWDESNCTRCTPFIILDNDYKESIYTTKGLDAVRITAAHEFFHALQLGYRWDPGTGNANIYWYEISSVWMEDMIYDTLNDYYQYLSTYFKNSNSSLTSFNGWIEYSKAPLAFYMSEKYSPEIIRQCWDDFTNPGRVPHVSFNTILPGGFVSNFAQFAHWNTFTGTQSIPDSFYSEGSRYPQLTYSEWLIPGNLSITINPLAVKYYVFNPTQNGGVRFHYSSNCIGFLKGILYDGSYHSIFFNESLTADQPAVFPNLSLYREIIIGLVNPSTATITSIFTLEFDSTLSNIGFIKGIVSDRNSNPIEKAHIKIYNPTDGQVIGLTQSNQNGSFSLPVMDSHINQSLSLHIEAQGYGISEIPGIVPANHQDTVLTIHLTPLSDQQIGAWPNPFSDRLRFGYFQAYDFPVSESYHIQIYTLDGRIIYELQGEDALNYIDIPSQPLEKIGSGVFIYYFKLGSTIHKGKIIKKNN